MTDQLAPQFTRVYGNPRVRIPHMEALAENGARFDYALPQPTHRYAHLPAPAP